MGVLFEHLGKPKLSIEYLTQALQTFIEFKDSVKMAKAFTNLGNSYLDINDLHLAQSYYRKALVIDSLYQDTISLITDYNNLGYLYTRFNQHKLAKAFFTKSFQLIGEEGNLYDLCVANFNLGLCELELENKSVAEKLLLKSYNLATKINSIDYLSKSAEKLSEYYEKEGRKQLALNYLREYQTWLDSAEKL